MSPSTTALIGLALGAASLLPARRVGNRIAWICLATIGGRAIAVIALETTGAALDTAMAVRGMIEGASLSVLLWAAVAGRPRYTLPLASIELIAMTATALDATGAISQRNALFQLLGIADVLLPLLLVLALLRATFAQSRPMWQTG